MRRFGLNKKNLSVFITALCVTSPRLFAQSLQEPELLNAYTDVINISYRDECTLDHGCDLSFKYSAPQENFTNNLESGLELNTNHDAKKETLIITSIISVDEPALLQNTPQLVPSAWYSQSSTSTLKCVYKNKRVICSNFAPVGKKFDLFGTLGTQNIALRITVNDDVKKVNTPSELKKGCGQFGTPYQRIFDCSQRVKHFAGIGKSGSTSADFEIGNPDPNWFLVACPKFEKSITEQQCSWLSPVIAADNPSVGANYNDRSDNVDRTFPDLGPNGATRILWSGLLKKGALFTFFEVNGTDASGYANCNGNGLCADYSVGAPPYTPQTRPWLFNEFVKTRRSFDFNLPNMCTESEIQKDQSISGMTTVAWQVPSYPLLMTLTGSSIGCPFGVTDSGCNGRGFSAISSPAPNFLQGFDADAFLWSSSGYSYNLPEPTASIGHVFNNGMNVYASFSSRLGVRCVSPVF